MMVLAFLFFGQQPTKITSVFTKEGVSNVPDSIGEIDVHDQDVVACANADDQNGSDKGVCYLDLPSGRNTLGPKKSVYMSGAGHLVLHCGKKGERACHIVVIQGFPKP